MSDNHHSHNKLTLAGLLITLGIIYGDIGTSPLYVMKAIVGEKVPINADFVLGGISCVFWTLTLQTTIKYVMLTLQADNKGEGGIFSLYTLVRKRAKWLLVPAMIGGATLLADGIITPPISVASAIEGLKVIYPKMSEDYIVGVVLAIITLLFVFQRFGTAAVGKFFGPVMLWWFSMLAGLGILQIITNPSVIFALNPYHAYNLLANSPAGFWVLGAVFLCTTGAEALYSDLGHCGRENIRMSWVFVKTCLVLNYMGQGAWLIAHNGQILGDKNPFYTIMPEWFLLTGIITATLAAIIASQALITGSFTLISEAIRLNLWPKVTLNYPSNVKGQLYVPSANLLLWIGCCTIVLYFRESKHMEAAYGLSITLTMIMTTLLMVYYLRLQKFSIGIIVLFLIGYLTIEIAFLVANLVKFMEGGFITIIVASLILSLMFVIVRSDKIKNRLKRFEKMATHIFRLIRLSNDETVPQFATNLVYLTAAHNDDEIETNIIHSIFNRQPKRAQVYWFVHVKVTDEPYTTEYSVDILAPEDVYRITFYLGFRVEQRVSMFFRMAVSEMAKNGEVNIKSRYKSLDDKVGDFKFVIIKQFLSNENDLPLLENLIMDAYFGIKSITPSDERWFGLDASSVLVEKMPMVIKEAKDVTLKRVATKTIDFVPIQEHNESHE
jgi:KUP system potassium uptake protein